MSCPEFWEEQHAKRDQYWLTDSNPQSVLKMHHVLPEFGKCQRFLDIGVGFGGMSRYVKSQKKYVISADVSQTGLNNLKDVVDETILIDSVSSISPVDLALCHLVFQHCPDEVIKKIIADVPLKETGILSVQFACLRSGEKANATVKSLLDKGTHFLRSLDEFRQLVSETGKEVIEVQAPIDYRKGENLRWYMCKLKNKKT